MGKLYFRYGAMGASKTANALMTKYNYEERENKVLLLKPKCENRDGEKIIKSRIGLSSECEIAEDFLSTFKNFETNQITYDVIIVDEVQFLKTEYIDILARIADYYDIPIICYGLRTDFQSNLFEGSKRLMELANKIEEIPTVCWCGKKAHFNARIKDNKIIYTGNQIEMGSNDKYISLCRKHYFEGKIN